MLYTQIFVSYIGHSTGAMVLLEGALMRFSYLFSFTANDIKSLASSNLLADLAVAVNPDKKKQARIDDRKQTILEKNAIIAHSGIDMVILRDAHDRLSSLSNIDDAIAIVDRALDAQPGPQRLAGLSGTFIQWVDAKKKLPSRAWKRDSNRIITAIILE
jgi:hypothetical protein